MKLPVTGNSSSFILSGIRTGFVRNGHVISCFFDAPLAYNLSFQRLFQRSFAGTFSSSLDAKTSHNICLMSDLSNTNTNSMHMKNCGSYNWIACTGAASQTCSRCTRGIGAPRRDASGWEGVADNVSIWTWKAEQHKQKLLYCITVMCVLCRYFTKVTRVVWERCL